MKQKEEEDLSQRDLRGKQKFGKPKMDGPKGTVKRVTDRGSTCKKPRRGQDNDQ